jgi:hypothetical protein
VSSEEKYGALECFDGQDVCREENESFWDTFGSPAEGYRAGGKEVVLS